MEKHLRTRLASLGILALVFASGAVLGVAWERTTSTPAAAEASGEAGRSAEEEGDEDDDRRRRRRIIDRVGLRPAQEERVDSIIEIHRERMRELHREFREEYNPRYRGLIQETRDALRAVLDGDQRARYDSLLAEYDRKRKERRDDDDRRDRRDDDGDRREGSRGERDHRDRDRAHRGPG